MLKCLNFLDAGRSRRFAGVIRRRFRRNNKRRSLRVLSGLWQKRRGGRKLHAPKARRGFDEFQFHEAGCRPVDALALHLGDNFALKFRIGEQEQLAMCDGRGQADHTAIFMNEYGIRFFGEQDALDGILVEGQGSGQQAHDARDHIRL